MTTIAQEGWFRDARLASVLALLNSDGGEARIVGGAVRNTLMGLPVSDIDIATTLAPEDVLLRAQKHGVKSVPTGIDHGTVTLVVEGTPFEITTLRKDVETDGRHARVQFTDDWKADAERRDLTINALYADAAGNVHDYVGGLADIESGTIRFIGSASQRISEDYLRVLRFFRFFAHYGKGRPDPEGLKACAAAKDKLGTLSAERVWSEMKKLLGASDPFRALLWMRTSGVLSHILPETEKWGIDLIPGLVVAETKFGWPSEALVRLAAMVPPDEDRLALMADRLRMSLNEKKFLVDFARCPQIGPEMTEAALRRLQYERGKNPVRTRLVLALAALQNRDESDADVMAKTGSLTRLFSVSSHWTPPAMPVSGRDLIAMGYEPGPVMGKKLAELEGLWVGSDFSMKKEELIAAASVEHNTDT